MSYSEIYALLKGRGSTTDIGACLGMNNFTNYDQNTTVAGTGMIGGKLNELSQFSLAEAEIDKLNKLKHRLDRDLKQTLYNVSIPEVATYGVIERSFGLGTDDINKRCYVCVSLQDILVYVGRHYVPIIPNDDEAKEIYQKLGNIVNLYKEDSSSLAQITLDEDLMYCVETLMGHIEENNKSIFIKPTPSSQRPVYPGVFSGLSDGLFTSKSRSLLAPRRGDALEAAQLADGSLESQFSGDDTSFGTDALSVYLNK